MNSTTDPKAPTSTVNAAIPAAPIVPEPQPPGWTIKHIAIDSLGIEREGGEGYMALQISGPSAKVLPLVRIAEARSQQWAESVPNLAKATDEYRDFQALRNQIDAFAEEITKLRAKLATNQTAQDGAKPEELRRLVRAARSDQQDLDAFETKVQSLRNQEKKKLDALRDRCQQIATGEHLAALRALDDQDPIRLLERGQIDELFTAAAAKALLLTPLVVDRHVAHVMQDLAPPMPAEQTATAPPPPQTVPLSQPQYPGLVHVA
jgi:hypothetical protein